MSTHIGRNALKWQPEDVLEAVEIVLGEDLVGGFEDGLGGLSTAVVETTHLVGLTPSWDGQNKGENMERSE